jgi:hypothetical protein
MGQSESANLSQRPRRKFSESQRERRRGSVRTSESVPNPFTESVRRRRGLRSHFTPSRVIDGGRLPESLDGHPVGALAVLGLFFRSFRAMWRRRRRAALLSSRARASRARPSAGRSRVRSGLSRAERRPETPPRRLTPKSTWLTLASGTRGRRKSDAARMFWARVSGAPPEASRAAPRPRRARSRRIDEPRLPGAHPRRRATPSVRVVVASTGIGRVSLWLVSFGILCRPLTRLGTGAASCPMTRSSSSETSPPC